MFSKDKHRPEESRVSGEFSDQTPKAQLIKENSDKLDFINI